MSKPSLAKIEASGGLEYIVGRIGEGDSLSTIAAALQLPRSDLSGYLVNSDDPLYHQAMLVSAEVLYDRAEEALRAADTRSVGSVQQAKALSDLYTKRAGVRNVRYAARGAMLDLSTPAMQQAVPSFTIQIISGAQQRDAQDAQIIENDPS